MNSANSHNRLRADLMQVFEHALAEMHPARTLARHLPEPPPNGRLIVIGCGKMAATMAQAVEQHYLDTLGLPPERLEGLCVTRHGYGLPTRRIGIREAGHPIPDQAGVLATEAILALADSAGSGDLVLALMSGGGSANCVAPIEGVTLADKQEVTEKMLKAGAPVSAINVVRKHLSRFKGGQLALRAAPARILTLAYSDVPGDNPEIIASGPTVPDPSTLYEALASLKRYLPGECQTAREALERQQRENPNAHPAFLNQTYIMVATPRDMLRAAAEKAAELGYKTSILGHDLEGEARLIAREHAELALSLHAAGRKTAILSGGELTVTVSGAGQGGSNQEYAIALAGEIAGHDNIIAMAADTDGTDGGNGELDCPAGGIIDGDTVRIAAENGITLDHALKENDSRAMLTASGGLLRTGPTGVNLNDFRLILVDTAR